MKRTRFLLECQQPLSFDGLSTHSSMSGLAMARIRHFKLMEILAAQQVWRKCFYKVTEMLLSYFQLCQLHYRKVASKVFAQEVVLYLILNGKMGA